MSQPPTGISAGLASPQSLSIGQALGGLIRRELLLHYRRRAEILNPLIFFFIVVTLFPLAIGARPNLISGIGAGVIWVAALLAAMLPLDGIFRSDYEDGTLEQLVLSAQPLSLLVLGKVFAHWLVTGLPLLLSSPLLAVFLGIPADAIGVLMLSLLLGTPVLSLVGAIGVALTVGLRRGGMLLSLLVLPLYAPVLIFGASAVELAAGGFDVSAQLYILLALLLLACALAPWPTAAALRISLS